VQTIAADIDHLPGRWMKPKIATVREELVACTCQEND
jgi:hypothetical protein